MRDARGEGEESAPTGREGGKREGERERTFLQERVRAGPLFAETICAPAERLLMTMAIVRIDAG